MEIKKIDVENGNCFKTVEKRLVQLLLLFFSSSSSSCSWVSEASPTLGCSIEISRDIYMSVCMSVVCQINCVGGIT